jgi:hypothetical protein
MIDRPVTYGALIRAFVSGLARQGRAAVLAVLL